MVRAKLFLPVLGSLAAKDLFRRDLSHTRCGCVPTRPRLRPPYISPTTMYPTSCCAHWLPRCPRYHSRIGCIYHVNHVL
ncbi:hypothetical protein PLICRDRAFT_459264 [Plicaturopsis crispa FD-325 SS-3]|nr:hypothetical protein PLICRDRAFT_459264 [Plicaturopsis crispa FD-325 SS-3]